MSRLFAAGGGYIVQQASFAYARQSALESSEFAEDADKGEKGLSASMGLFLQKTNIIRDYLEARGAFSTSLPPLIFSS